MHYKEIFRGKNAVRRKFGEEKVINEAVLSVEDCKKGKGKMCHNKIDEEKSGAMEMGRQKEGECFKCHNDTHPLQQLIHAADCCFDCLQWVSGQRAYAWDVHAGVFTDGICGGSGLLMVRVESLMV